MEVIARNRDGHPEVFIHPCGGGPSTKVQNDTVLSVLREEEGNYIVRHMGGEWRLKKHHVASVTPAPMAMVAPALEIVEAQQREGNPDVWLRESVGGKPDQKVKNGTYLYVLEQHEGNVKVRSVDDPTVQGWAQKHNLKFAVEKQPDFGSQGAMSGEEEKPKIQREPVLGGWLASLVQIPLTMAINCGIWVFAVDMPSEWAVAVCLMSCGFIYVTAPVNWIPNSVPIIGKIDDLVLGLGPMALGALLSYEADKTHPLPRDPLHLAPLGIVGVVFVLSAVWKNFRDTVLGLIVLVLTPFVTLEFLPEFKTAVGVTLFIWGVIYLQLPFDLIPDSWPVFGRVDDAIFGWGFMLAGIGILAFNAVSDPASLSSFAASATATKKEF